MGDHTKLKLIQQKDSYSARPKPRTRGAAQHAQIMYLIRNRGFYLDMQGNRLDEAAYRAKVRADLHKRLAGAVLYYQINVDRAMDIMRHGEKSRWWFARDSTSSAGGDTTGIGVWMARLRRKARRGSFIQKWNAAVDAVLNGSME